MTYLITYDLKNPGQKYDNLIDAIKAYGIWAKISSSCWAIKTNQTAAQICDNLMLYIDANDILFVCDFDDWASYNLNKEVVNWLNS